MVIKIVERQSFTYTYSASANKEIQEIRKKYLPTEESKLNELKRLDRRVQTAGMAEALSIGVGGMMIFGTGMCVGLDVLGGGMLLSVILCTVGTAIMIPAYFIYRAIARRVGAKYIPKILKLADELDQSKGHTA